MDPLLKAILGKLVTDSLVQQLIQDPHNQRIRYELETILGPMPNEVKRHLGITAQEDAAFYTANPSLRRSGEQSWASGEEGSHEVGDPEGGEGRMSTQQEQKKDWKNVEVVQEGEQIIIPKGMTYREARTWLERREIELEQDIQIDEVVDAFPMEGAFAFAKAISKKYGFSHLVPTPGFFGPTPPSMIGVEVDVGRSEQVPWGRVQVPALSGHLATGLLFKENRYVFRITGVVKQKHKADVKALADLTRQIVRDESIYRGKAIRVKFPKPDENFDPRDCPKFMNTSDVKSDELIFSEKVRRKIEVSFFTPIERTDLVRAQKVPLKRGILLEGPYGTGKTLTANVAARKCVDNQWTFIYLSDVADLKAAIHFAKQYEPAVIFAEDIDRVLEGERDEAMNDILNTIDGVDTKNMELIVCLTTNHVSKIEPAMMRPGRLDVVVTVEPPDAAACLKLLTLYSRGLLDSRDKYDGVAEKLKGQIPAVIREVVERSKLAAISRLQKGEELTLRATDLDYSATEMLDHVKLMSPRPLDNRSDIEKAADRLGQHVASALGPTKNNGATNGNGNAKVPNERPSSASLPPA